jgi:hypothetical protein
MNAKREAVFDYLQNFNNEDAGRVLELALGAEVTTTSEPGILLKDQILSKYREFQFDMIEKTIVDNGCNTCSQADGFVWPTSSLSESVECPVAVECLVAVKCLVAVECLVTVDEISSFCCCDSNRQYFHLVPSTAWPALKVSIIHLTQLFSLVFHISLKLDTTGHHID